MASGKIERPSNAMRFSYFDVSIIQTDNSAVIITDLPSDFSVAVSAMTIQGGGNICKQIKNTSTTVTLYTDDITTSVWRIFYRTT